MFDSLELELHIGGCKLPDIEARWVVSFLMLGPL